VDAAIRIRKAQSGDGRELTRVAHAAKRFWGYPEKWIRLWKRDLTVTSDFIRDQPVFCAVRGSTIVGFYGCPATVPAASSSTSGSTRMQSAPASAVCSSATSSVIFDESG
jgi:hypothetical protein